MVVADLRLFAVGFRGRCLDGGKVCIGVVVFVVSSVTGRHAFAASGHLPLYVASVPTFSWVAHTERAMTPTAAVTIQAGVFAPGDDGQKSL